MSSQSFTPSHTFAVPEPSASMQVPEAGHLNSFEAQDTSPEKMNESEAKKVESLDGASFF